VKTSDGPLVAGSYGYRFAPPRTPGWDLERISDDVPPDLYRRLHDPRTFIERPG
jgi:hypothetical protein